MGDVEDEINKQMEGVEQEKKMKVIEFVWQRRKCFDRHVVLMLLEKIKDAETASITNVHRS